MQMKTFALALSATLLPSLAQGAYVLTHNDREKIGRPIPLNGQSWFVTCQGAWMLVPDGAIIVFRADRTCPYAMTTRTERTEAVAVVGRAGSTGSGWVAPGSLTVNRPCPEGPDGPRPTPNQDVEDALALMREADQAVAGLVQSAFGSDQIATLPSDMVIVYEPHLAVQSALEASGSSLAMPAWDPDTIRAIARMAGIAAADGDCEPPAGGGSPGGAPNHLDILQDYISAQVTNDQGPAAGQILWQSAPSARQTYYEDIAEAFRVPDRIGQEIGDELLIQYQSFEDMVASGIMDGHMR